jgi:hypothetical protein
LSFESWQAFYYAGWQWPWAVMVVPFAYAVFRVVARPRPVPGPLAPMLAFWIPLFLAETLLDPLSTGPLAKALGGGAGTALGLLFVLLGDFRVTWLVMQGVRPGAPVGRTALQGALVAVLPPITAGVTYLLAGLLWPDLPGQVRWLIHEVAFVLLAAWLAWVFVPARVRDPELLAFLRDVLGYVAAYYALWATADVLILAGVDAGWAVRIVPNQLYYAFFVPFVAWRAAAAWPRARAL